MNPPTVRPEPFVSGASLPQSAAPKGKARSDTVLLFGLIAVLVIALVGAIAIWGLVGLAMWALTLVPVVMVLLVVTTFG